MSLPTPPLERAAALAPEALAPIELAKLLALLRHARHGVFVFAVAESAAARAQAVASLERGLPGLPALEFRLTVRQRNPLAYLGRLDGAARHGPALVFISGLERVNTPADPETSWGYLEAQREALKALPHRLVFWVTPAGLVQAARLAPNVWSQRGGSFHFCSVGQSTTGASADG